MNPQVVVDFLDKPLRAVGWRDVRVADSLEPDFTAKESPVALVYQGPIKARGESIADNFQAQTLQEFIGIQICSLRSETEARRGELSDALLGKVLPGRDFCVQYADGKPLHLTREREWWIDIYFTEVHRRQAA